MTTLKDNYLDKIIYINNLLEECSEDNFLSLKEHLVDLDIQSYVFKKLSKQENAINWFNYFYEDKWFTAQQAFGLKDILQEGCFLKWGALFYLENVSKTSEGHNDKEIMNKLMNIINSLTNYYFEKNIKADNHLMWSKFIKILNNISNEEIIKFAKKKGINMVDHWINRWVEDDFDYSVVIGDVGDSLLKKFLTTDRRLSGVAEGILKLLLTVKGNAKSQSPMLMAQKYIIERNIQGNLEKIIDCCSDNIIYWLADQLIDLFREKNKKFSSKERYSHIWLPYLDQSPKYTPREAEDLLMIILKDIILKLCDIDRDRGEKVIDFLLSKPKYKVIFIQRIALYCIVKYWENYYNYFDDFMKVVGNPFVVGDFKLELSKLLDERTDQILNSYHAEEIKRIVKEAPGIRDESKPFFRQRWAGILQKTGDDFFKRIYKNSKKYTRTIIPSVGEERRKTGIYHLKSGKNILSEKKISTITIEDLISFLKENSKKSKKGFGWVEQEEISDNLRAAVSNDPKHFEDYLDSFIHLDPEYPTQMIWGYREAIRKGNEFDLGKILNFCQNYFDYINNQDSKKEPYRGFFEMFAILIEDMSRNNKSFNNKDYINLIKSLFDKAFDIYPYSKPKNEEDRNNLTTALNTPIGHLILGSLSFILYCARTKNNDYKEWAKRQFDILLEKGVLEAYIFFGKYLANYCYIDKNWAHKKIQDFNELSIKNERWQWFMEGYIKINTIYKDLYELAQNHYLRALNFEWGEKGLKYRLMEHICIGYLWGKESIEDKTSLFRKLLDERKFSIYQKIVSFFWSYHKDVEEDYKRRENGPEDQKDKDIERVKEKIISFWKWLYVNDKRIQADCGDGYGKLLSDLLRFVIFIEELDDTKSKWLLSAAPYVDEAHHSYFVWRYLKRFNGDEKSAKYLAPIILEMVKHVRYIHQREDLRSIIKNLYEKGQKKWADKICNNIGRQGYEDLVLDIYGKYNK